MQVAAVYAKYVYKLSIESGDDLVVRGFGIGMVLSWEIGYKQQASGGAKKKI